MSVREADVVEVWAEVIGVDSREIDVDTSFFDLGGSSLLLIQLSDRLNDAFGINTSVVTLLEFPTIEQFVEHVNAEIHQPEG